MEANYFTLLNLRPGRYSPAEIDRQYATVCRQISRGRSADSQRKLDDALIAQSVLRNPSRQANHLRRVRNSIGSRPRRQGRLSTKPAPSNPPRRRRPKAPVLLDGPVPTADEGVYKRFAKLVEHHVSGGVLRYTARQRLMMMAEALKIGPFKANLIIAEVLHDVQAGRLRPGSQITQTPDPAADRPANRPMRWGWRVGLAAALAVIIDLAVLAWLLG